MRSRANLTRWMALSLVESQGFLSINDIGFLDADFFVEDLMITLER